MEPVDSDGQPRLLFNGSLVALFIQKGENGNQQKKMHVMIITGQEKLH